MSEHRNTMLQLFRTEKEASRHAKLNEAITVISNTFSSIAHAYLCKLALEDLTDALSDRLDKACDAIEQASSALSNSHSEYKLDLETSCKRIETACTDLANRAPADVVGMINTSYAAALASTKQPLKRANTRTSDSNILLSRGISFPIESTDLITIGPCDGAKEKYTSSIITRDELQKAINPADLKMRVKRTILGSNNSVIIEGYNLDATALSNYPVFIATGLKVMPNPSFNPPPSHSGYTS